MSFDTTPPHEGASDSADTAGEVVLTDPLSMRALAHPVRLAILGHLRSVGSATASECADVVGATPSACSFHLRALHRFGLVEEDRTVRAHGRQRPWRARPVRLAFDTLTTEREGERTARQMWDLMRAGVERARQDAINHDAEFPAAWRRATGSDHVRLSVTAAELASLRWAIMALLEGVQARAGSTPNPQARPVEVVIDYVPRFLPTEADGAPEKRR